MRTIFVVLLVVFLASLNIKAQSFRWQNTKEYRIQRNAIDEFRDDKFVDGGFISNKNLKYSEISGTPYLNNEFKKGTVLTSSGTLLDNYLLRYNMYDDQIEYIQEGVVYELAPKSLVKRAEFDGLIFVYIKYKNKGNSSEGFCEVLVEGKASLYRKHKIKFIPPAQGLPYNESNPAHFAQPEEYFYVSTGYPHVSNLINNKELSKILIDKKSETDLFISKNKLSVKKGEDLIKIFKYYNSL